MSDPAGEQSSKHAADGQSLLPDLFVAGFAKCGTTTLHDLLCAAGAQSGRVKEVGFMLRADFDDEAIADAYRRSFGERRSTVLLDATPWYAYDDDVRERIVRLTPRAKVLLVVRSPVDRVRSLYLDRVRSGDEHRTLEDAIRPLLGRQNEIRRYRPGVTINDYLATSTYAGVISRWAATGLEVRVLALESLHGGSGKTVGELGRWLGLELADRIPRSNQGGSVRTFGGPLQRLVGGRSRLLPRRLRPRVVAAAQPILDRMSRWSIPGRPVAVGPDVGPETMALLEQYFAPDRAALEALPTEMWVGPRAEWVTTRCPPAVP